jgi:preprotein translocase subunit SecF
MNKFKKSKFSIDGLIDNSKFDYCKNLKWFLIAPLVILLVGIILLCTVGFNLGIDFTGGSILNIYANNEKLISEEYSTSYDITKDSEYNAMRDRINKVFAREEFDGINVDIFRTTSMDIGELGVSKGQGIQIQYQNREGETGEEIQKTNEAIRKALQEEFGYIDHNVVGENYTEGVSAPEVVTATASSELLMNAFIAMIVAIAFILVYVALRFELTSGLAAILALFHDLLIMTSLVLIFRVQINSSFVAGLVTILGYSINNTIIIFDRIRENTKNGKFTKAKNAQIANASVKETMTRSLFTTITTLITIAMVAIIGVSDIRDFALPILFGIGAGFYSSVFLTPGLWAIAYKPKKKKALSAK